MDNISQNKVYKGRKKNCFQFINFNIHKFTKFSFHKVLKLDKLLKSKSQRYKKNISKCKLKKFRHVNPKVILEIMKSKNILKPKNQQQASLNLEKFMNYKI